MSITMGTNTIRANGSSVQGTSFTVSTEICPKLNWTVCAGGIYTYIYIYNYETNAMIFVVLISAKFHRKEFFKC